MAPKGLSQAQKQAAAVSYLRSSRTVHTLKELEKMLPSVASVGGMQMKEFIQSLQSENMITVEKIGSGNWYWNFASDELKARETTLASLHDSEAKLKASIESSEVQLGNIAMTEEEKEEHRVLMAELEVERAEVAALERELESHREGDPVELDNRRKEVEAMKEKAVTWTDNIYVLEGVLTQMFGGDRAQMESLKAGLYEDEYVEGEGLKEWDN